MLSALLYLRLTSFANWTIARVKSLRRPKQLAGAAVFALYFWFFFLRHWSAPPRDVSAAQRAAHQAVEAAGVGAAMAIDWLPPAMAIGALILLALGTLMWILPTRRAGLNFSEAEIAFLFPAPISRRALIHFRLLSTQVRSLIGAAIMMLMSNRWTFLDGSPLTHALGWWFVFSALSLHHNGARFTLTRLGDAGLRIGVRRGLILAAIIAVIGIAWWRLPAAFQLPVHADAAAPRAFATWVVALADTAPLQWVLAPIHLVLAPFFAADARSFLMTLGPALALLIAHYLWVVRSAVAFEDASIQQAEERATRVAAWRAGRSRMGELPTAGRKDPFHLASVGRAELAFLWKNLLSAWPYFTPRVFAASAFVIAAGCYWLRRETGAHALLPMIASAAAIIAGYILVLGPQFARQDLRSDLTHADILKTYPLAGWRIVLGELLAPVAILTGGMWLALLALTLTFSATRDALEHFPLTARLVCAFWLGVIAPVAVTLQMLVPNAAALLFPAWFQSTRGQGGGPEVAGQRMIFFFAQAVTMLVALLPPAGVGALLLLVGMQYFRLSLAVAVNLAAIPFLVVLVVEVACGIWLLGRQFERLDSSSELRA